MTHYNISEVDMKLRFRVRCPSCNAQILLVVEETQSRGTTGLGSGVLEKCQFCGEVAHCMYEVDVKTSAKKWEGHYKPAFSLRRWWRNLVFLFSGEGSHQD